MRGVAALLAVAGAAGIATAFALMVQGRPASDGGVLAAIGGGAALFIAGFAIMLRKRGRVSRAAAVFSMHATIMAATAATFWFWVRFGGDLEIAAFLALLLAVQAVFGFVLLCMAAFNDLKKGWFYGLGVLVYITCSIGLAFLTLRGL